MDKSPTSAGERRDSDGASTLDLSGRSVGSSYLLIRPIGQGATGTVWRGVDQASGEPVAIKLLHESLLRQPKLVTRFVQERTILLMLRHRNVVRVRDLFSVGESLGLVMDLVPGGSLREHLRTKGPLPAGEAARLASQVAAALAEAHELGIVHRDLKPDNILLCTTDGRLDTRLTDFGIARVLNTPALTTPNAVVGTPHYMSPEAFHGSGASPAADVYALGILLYELVCGRPPYESDNVADLMRRHLQGGPERRDGIPDALWTVIASCLERKPRLRPTAGELIGELEGVARTEADAPALPPLSPPVEAPADDPSVKLSVIPAQRPPRRRNQAPSWRWARPGAIVALIAGTMLASGVATTAWHMSRADGTTRIVATGPSAPPSAAASPAPRPSGPAVTTPATGSPPAPERPAARVSTTSAKPSPASRSATRKPPQPEAREYGPWECKQSVQFVGGMNALLASPCRTTGAAIQYKATMVASPGKASVTLTLKSGGRTVGGPHTCPEMVFREGASTQECGRFTSKGTRGRTYVVVMSWTYTRDGRSTSGSANSGEFTF